MTDALLRALLPIFLIIALGILAGRSGRLDNVKVAPLNTLVMEFALPAGIFATVSRADRHQLFAQWTLLLVIAAGLLALWLLVFALQRVALRKPAGMAAVLAISVALPNFAAAGVPLAASVLGEQGRVQVALAIALGATILSPLTLVLLDIDRLRRERGTEGAEGSGAEAVRAALRRVCTAPLVLSPILAILCVLLGLRLPQALMGSFTLLGQASSGVALLLTGLVLSANRIALGAGIVLSVLLANLVHPILAAGLCGVLPASGQILHASVLLSALPSGFFGILFAVRYGVEVREAASIVAISTLLSVATLPVALVLTAGLP